MIAIVNYGLGNLHSVQKAVEYVGGKPILTDDPDVLHKADKVILPGVGAFCDGMDGLQSRSLVDALLEISETGKPLLGICLGMQLLFDESEEQGNHRGLGLLPGKVVIFSAPDIKVPQIGWNQAQVKQISPLFEGIESGAYFYFNHSYYCVPQNPEHILADTPYRVPFASAVVRDNLFGVQFHPEKSQQVGLRLLQNFVEL